jgi:hypothetical protein
MRTALGLVFALLLAGCSQPPTPKTEESINATASSAQDVRTHRDSKYGGLSNGAGVVGK